jgi:hypothetical protein
VAVVEEEQADSVSVGMWRPPLKREINNYLFDNKKVTLFFTGFFSSDKTAVLSRVQVKGWEDE